MVWSNHAEFSRRSLSLLAGGAALSFLGLARARTWATTQPETDIRLIAGPARVPLVGGEYADTDVWAYNGSVPGPELRFKQGQHVRIAVENRLQEETT
ncbi:MAG: multicopper oxidase domain-containing protein, partial [Gammaproteobacteria bacterium]